MTRQLYHTISITLPKDIEDRLRNVRNKISEKFPDQYSYLAAGAVWEAHVALFTLCVDKIRGDQMLNRAKEIAKTIEPIDLYLGKIELSNDSKYIFLNFREDSEERLKKLHEEFFTELDPIRKGEVPEKFQQHWDELSETEKELLIRTGSKYPFVPHFSLVKLLPEEAKSAIEEINVRGFENTLFTLTGFNFTRQDEVKENEFPKIATIILGKGLQR